MAAKVPVLVVSDLLMQLHAAAGDGVRNSEDDRKDQAEPQHVRDKSEASEHQEQDDGEDEQHGNLQLDAQPLFGRDHSGGPRFWQPGYVKVFPLSLWWKRCVVPTNYGLATRA